MALDLPPLFFEKAPAIIRPAPDGYFRTGSGLILRDERYSMLPGMFSGMFFSASLPTISLSVGAGVTVTNYNLFAQAGSPSVPVNVLFVNNGTINATSTGSAALVVSGFASGSIITIVNNGSIIGKGGNGGAGADTNGNFASAPTAGGNAIGLGNDVTIQNNGTIAGGGGGGGGGGYSNSYITGSGGDSVRWGGSGGGGGRSNTSSNSSGGAAASGIGGSGANGDPGTSSSQGAGGPRTYTSSSTYGGSPVYNGAGGDGGFYGAAGATGANGARVPSFNTQTPTSGYSGAAGGRAVNVAGHAVNWTATGTRYGAYT